MNDSQVKLRQFRGTKKIGNKFNRGNIKLVY